MDAANRIGADAEIIRLGERYAARWKGSAYFYTLLAGAYWGRSRWSEAIAAGRRALALDARQLQAAVFLLASYRAVSPQRGIAFGEHWLQRHGADANLCRHLSLLYDDVDQPASALAVARRGFAQAPKNRRLAACLANYLAKVEGSASALRFAADHRALFAGDIYGETTLAKGLSSAGDYAEAEKVLASLHGRHPRNAEIFESWLDALYHLRRFADVLVQVQTWENTSPLTGSMANDAGRACLELGLHDDAVAWMQRAMQLAPDSAKYADNHAMTLGRVNRHTEAIAAARQRLAAGGKADRRRLLTSIAVAHTHLEQHAEAQTVYEQAYAEFPDHDEALLNVIVGLTWLNRYADAVAFARGVPESRRSGLPARFWSEFAWSLHQTADYAAEADVIADWGRRYPEDLDVVRTMKRVLNQLDRRAEALTFVRTWVDAHPESAGGWHHLADQYEFGGDTEAELTAREAACRLAPDEVDYVAERLATLRRLQRSQEALALGTAWLELHPQVEAPVLVNRLGLAADDLERWPAAEAFYLQAHRARPRDGTFFGNVQRALICQDRASEAAALGRRWLAENPWNTYVASKQAWALRTAGLRPEETDVLRQAVAAAPSDPDLHYSLLASLLAQQRTTEAATFLEHCAAAGLVTSRFYNEWANHLRELSRLAEAEPAYRRALELSPTNDTAAGNLASLLVLLERCAEAVQLCSSWLATRPGDHYVRRQLAHACYTCDDHAQAEREYRTLHALAPADAFVFDRLIACQRLLERYAPALAEAERWLLQHPASAFLCIERGICAQRLDRWDEALRHYEQALEREPTSVAAAWRALRALVQLGRSDDALRFGQQWHDAHPAHLDGNMANELGIVADRAGQVEWAERLFRRAVELQPGNATFAGNAVEIVARRGQPEESIRLGQSYQTGHPPSAYLLRRLADVYAAQHEPLAALDLLTTADVLDPADEDIALSYLLAASDADEVSRGVEFGRAWLARPGNETRARVWSRFARSCFRADRHDEACQAIARAAELEPDELAHERLRLAFANARGDSMAVLQAFEQVRPEWREDAALLRHASRAHRDLGLPAEALALARRALACNPADDEACAYLAQLHHETGDTREAEECLQAWVACHGDQPAVLRVRCRLALEAGNYAAALADATAALGHDAADEPSFVVSIRALRALDRHAEARTRLHHWLEHQGSSPQIEELLDEHPA